MTTYYAPPGHDATPKPLALLRERLKHLPPWDARLRFYQEVHWRWLHTKPAQRRKSWRFYRDLWERHHYKIVEIAMRESERQHERAA